MKIVAAGLVALAAAMTLATPAGAVPNTDCTLGTPVQEVTSVTQLPAALAGALPPIADIGAPFNSTDSVLDPSLPFRRLIRAGHRGDDWFLWYEHGGLAYYWQVVVARVDGDRMSTLANAGTVTDTLCAVTDGALAGRVPPYPDGAWESSSF
ncbi:MAG TPA: hypothetical protein VIJ23_20210 [Mycobacterium sp.]